MEKIANMSLERPGEDSFPQYGGSRVNKCLFSSAASSLAKHSHKSEEKGTEEPENVTSPHVLNELRKPEIKQQLL